MTNDGVDRALEPRLGAGAQAVGPDGARGRTEAEAGETGIGAPQAAREEPVGSDTYPWRPIPDLRVTNDRNDRSRQAYLDVINQFDVENNRRYRWDPNNTYCHIFVWDVTTAMQAEIPHLVTLDDLRRINPARAQEEVEGQQQELTANENCAWLETFGADHDWTSTDQQDAQDRANSGEPVVAAWQNPQAEQGRIDRGRRGHLAMVRPGSVTDEGVTIAQAGTLRSSECFIADGFGADWRDKDITYWWHP